MAEGGHKQVHLREAEKSFCDTCKQEVDSEQKKCLHCNLYVFDRCQKEISLTKNHIKMEPELAEYENINWNNEDEDRDKDEISTSEIKLTLDFSEKETVQYENTKTLYPKTDLEAIQAQQELPEQYKYINSSNADTEYDLPTFIEGKTDNMILKPMYESLDTGKALKPMYESLDTGKAFSFDTGEDSIPVTTNTDVEIIHRFNPRSTSVTAICPFTENNALIHYGRLYENDIVTVNGEVQRTLYFDFEVLDFILTSQGDIMATHNSSEPTIYILTMEGDITDAITTAPLLPVYLCESRDGNLLVSLMDEMSYDINKSSRRCVSRITMTGKVLESYEYNKGSRWFHKGSRLFTKPATVSENVNRDVCVVNRTSEDTGHLVILDRHGKLKFRYNGQLLDKDFDPCDVKCDISGNIIVADFNNVKVHLLDIKGKFLRYIVTENNLSDLPLSLAIDNRTGILWIGCYNKDIYTMRYQK